MYSYLQSTTLAALNGTDGSDLYGGLVQGSNGILYGTTFQGGTSDEGTVFSLTPYGNGADYSYTLTTMFDFSHSDGNGTSPADTLIQGLDGNLYGTASGFIDQALATVFKITPGGTLTTLLSFSGVSIRGGLVQDSTGIFYGTTINGGTANGSTVFRYNPSNVENVTFTTSTDIPLTSSSYTITGSSLNVILDYAPMPGTVLTVDRNTGTTDAISGTFTNLPNGGTISASYEGTNYTFTANYSGGAGKDLTLTLTSSTIISDTPLLPLWAWLVLVAAMFVAGSRRRLPGGQ